VLLLATNGRRRDRQRKRRKENRNAEGNIPFLHM
jgi:hypothetical protein